MERVDFEELGYDTEKYLDTFGGEPFTGIAYETHPDGSLASETAFTDGLKDGRSVEWYASGQIKEEYFMRQGSGHGLLREWFENGSLKREKMREYGIAVWDRTYDEEGNLVESFVLPEDDVLYKILMRRRDRQ